MLFLTTAWTVLILACFVIGIAILNWVQGDCFERIGDRFIVAVWLGVIILAVSLLAASLVLPLSPLVGAVITVSLAAVALRSHRTRTEIVTLRSVLSLAWIFRLITLALAVAAFEARAITWYDTGLYHFQVIRWLSRFGAVPGLALIHGRFGFTSSWFALAAPFNAGIFEARIGAITGGFAFLLATLHFLISTARILKNQGSLEDWFVITSLSISLPIVSLLGLSALRVSPSPDLPVIILTVLVAWTIIVISGKKIKTDKNSTRDPKIIPLLLSAGAVTMKVSALPLLFVSFFFYIFGKRLSVQRILFCSAISFLLILPMLIFGLITSGCPLYPSSLMCLDLPWSVGEEKAKAMSEVIQNWARWSGPTPAYANSWNWLWHWVKSEKKELLIFLIICSILSLVAIAKASNKVRIRGQNYLLALGGLGLVFMIYAAPTLRFGLGYLAIIPAFLIAIYCTPFRATAVLIASGVSSHSWLIPYWRPKIVLVMLVITIIVYLVVRFYQPKITSNVFPIFLLFLMVIVPLKNYSVKPNTQLHLLLPPKIQTPKKLLDKKVNNIIYFKPDGKRDGKRDKKEDRCWAAELPCTPYLTHKNIKLRDPERGIGAGFIRD